MTLLMKRISRDPFLLFTKKEDDLLFNIMPAAQIWYLQLLMIPEYLLVAEPKLFLMRRASGGSHVLLHPPRL